MSFRNGIEDGDCLQIDQEPVIHESALLGVTFPQIIEINPVRRVRVVDLLRESMLEVTVLLSLSRDEECDEFTLLLNVQVRCLVFELSQ